MNRIFFLIIAVVILGSFADVPAQSSPTGFAVWSEGHMCDGELNFRKVEKGQLGPIQVAVEKGPGSDLWNCISYDGVWVAFGRSVDTVYSRYGGCDIREFDNFDVYIAKIDNGRNLPAKAIKVDHGCQPLWGSDGINPNEPKTLFYNRYSDESIRKAIINPDGTIQSKDILHGKTPEKAKGAPQMQVSPNGRYLAYRSEGIVKVWDFQQNTHVPNAGGRGVYSFWGPRSKYLAWGDDSVCSIHNGQGTKLKSTGNWGRYWSNISNEIESDKGRLWIIGRKPSRAANSPSYLEIKPVDISGGDWKVGAGTVIGEGVTCDIHMLPQNNPVKTDFSSKPVSNTYLKPHIRFQAKRLVWHNENDEPAVVSVFNLYGKRIGQFRVFKRETHYLEFGEKLSRGLYTIRLNTRPKQTVILYNSQ